MANAVGSNSTLFRGIAIMKLVADSIRGLSIAEIVELTGLAKPTVHRIAIQLEEEGYLQRGPDKRFAIGYKLKQFSLSILSNVAVGAPRHAILESLAEEIGETCNCAMLDGNHTVYFDRVECNWPIKVDLHLGSHLPLHATASGKLFLAYMRPKERSRLLNATTLTQNTEGTYVSPELLEPELKKIKKEGVSFDNEEFLSGMVAMAVPVFDQANRICFTVAVHAPTTRRDVNGLREFIPALQKAATALASYYCHDEG